MPDDAAAATATITRLQRMSARIGQKPPLALDEAASYLGELAAYECWLPYLALTESCLHHHKKSGPEALLPYLLALVKVKHLYLNDREGAAQATKRLVSETKLSFAQFRHQVLSHVLREGDTLGEAKLLGAAAEAFSVPAEQIACLEHLCLLFSKKIANDEALPELYERILQLDPNNLKALRYFKSVYSQNGAWEDASKLLQRMLPVASHPSEVYRIAHELAAVYLYQLAKPAKAISILEAYCQHSPLDTTNLAFDAYLRLKDWQGGLRVLSALLARLSDPKQQAVVHYHRAGLLVELAQPQEASKQCRLALQRWPSFLEPLEQLITLAAQENDWSEVKNLLEHLLTLLQGEREKRLIAALVTQLPPALNGAERTT